MRKSVLLLSITTLLLTIAAPAHAVETSHVEILDPAYTDISNIDQFPAAGTDILAALVLPAIVIFGAVYLSVIAIDARRRHAR